MKALGCREAKRNNVVSGQGGVQARDGGGEEGGDFSGTLSARQKLGRDRFCRHMVSKAFFDRYCFRRDQRLTIPKESVIE